MKRTKQKPARPTIRTRRVTGQHHLRTHHYLNVYWPYLPIFAVLGIGIFFSSLLARQHHSALGYATDVSSQQLLADSNEGRLANHQPSLQISPQLTAAAQSKAKDMAGRNYWSHVTPDGKQPWSFIDASGYQYRAAGENLAYGFGTSGQVLTAWLHSPEHRANVLNSNFQDVGFAMANVANYRGNGPETIVVALYGEPVSGIETTNHALPAVLGAQTRHVSQLHMLSTSSWLPTALAAVCGVTIGLFFARHAWAWHRVLLRGEAFALTHPLFDVALLSLAAVGFVLMRAVGSIL